MVGAGDVVELPAVGLSTLVLKDSVVSVEEFRGFWPGLDVAATADAGTRVKGRAAVVRVWVSASSSALSAGAADQIALHGVACNGAEDVWVLSDLIGVVDGRADAHAVGAIRFFKG